MNCITELLDYQLAGVEKLSKVKIGALYMEQGTGKTRTALELICSRINVGKITKVLWLCPCSVQNEIQRELVKHLGYIPNCITIKGIESLSSSDRLYLELIKLCEDNAVYLVIDESNLIKNGLAIRTKRITQLSKLCKYKLMLNGTPISKNEADLFSQWFTMDWRVLGYKSYWSFAHNHIVFDETIKNRIIQVTNINKLTTRIAPYTYQVQKRDVLALPIKCYTDEGFYITDEQRQEYRRVKDMFLSKLDEAQPATIYRLFTALQNVISGLRITSSIEEQITSEKMFTDPLENPRVDFLLNTILDEDKKQSIIFCKYTHEIETLLEVLGENAIGLYGSMSHKQRNNSVDEMKKEKKQFLIANKNCAGYGLNLQFINSVIYYSNDWNLATRLQSEDRVHRIGQDKEVSIRDICAELTIDERILKSIRRKENMLDAFKRYVDKNKNELSYWLDGGDISEKLS